MSGDIGCCSVGVTNCGRLEVNLAQPAQSAGDMEELDYHGSLVILRSLAKLPHITSMCFSQEPGRVDKKEMVSIGLKRSMLELAQSCFKDTCHDTIFPVITSLAIRTTTYGKSPFFGAISNMRQLESMDLPVHEDVDEGEALMLFLREVHQMTPLKTLKMRHFDELHNTRGTASATTHLSDVLYEHSATLRHVELTGYLRREAWILHLVKTMRSELQLESCRVRFECDDYPVLALRQLLRLLAGSEIISNRV